MELEVTVIKWIIKKVATRNFNIVDTTAIAVGTGLLSKNEWSWFLVVITAGAICSFIIEAIDRQNGE